MSSETPTMSFETQGVWQSRSLLFVPAFWNNKASNEARTETELQNRRNENDSAEESNEIPF